MAKSMYEGAEAYVHFGSATDHPMRTVKCNAIRKRAVVNKQIRHDEKTGEVYDATDYQVSIGRDWGTAFRRVWINSRDGYLIRFEGKWCRVSVVTGE